MGVAFYLLNIVMANPQRALRDVNRVPSILGYDYVNGVVRPINVDATGALANPSLSYLFYTDGTYNYYASALPGTSSSASSWKVCRILVSDGVTTTWAGGNANYANAATNLATVQAYTYS